MLAFILFAQATVIVPADGCETVGTELFCPPANINDPLFGGAAQSTYRDRVETARRELAKKERGSIELRKRVGILVSNGDCAGAFKLALTEGDFDLAKQAQQLCAASAKPNSN